MAKMSKTWWGEKFIEALGQFLDQGRLRRGRSYRSDYRILSFDITENVINALVRGNINHYFGVYKEPKYKVSIKISPISKTKWTKIIGLLSSNAAWISKLLMNEMPDTIEDAFSGLNLHFLPAKAKDFNTDCSCPDWSNPCKHIAGVYYRVASMLDSDPFLLFQLRGLSKEKLQKELSKTALGQALLSGLTSPDALEVKDQKKYYTLPLKEPITAPVSLKEFWAGKMRVPKSDNLKERGQKVPGILIKKQGDYPAFWNRDNSFITAMENIYEQVKKKNKERL